MVARAGAATLLKQGVNEKWRGCGGMRLGCGTAKRALKRAGGVLQSRAMQVRPANRKDLPEILEIYNEAVLNTTASYDYEPRTLEHRTQWYEERVKAHYPIFVAEDGKGQVVGW